LAAGQVRLVHEEAVARLRQACWQAVPFQPVLPSQPDVTGVDIAAALVPRCRSSLIEPWPLAIKIRNDIATEESTTVAPQPPELAEELS
jgi:hypothetical protein